MSFPAGVPIFAGDDINWKHASLAMLSIGMSAVDVAYSNAQDLADFREFAPNACTLHIVNVVLAGYMTPENTDIDDPSAFFADLADCQSLLQGFTRDMVTRIDRNELQHNPAIPLWQFMTTAYAEYLNHSKDVQ